MMTLRRPYVAFANGHTVQLWGGAQRHALLAHSTLLCARCAMRSGVIIAIIDDSVHCGLNEQKCAVGNRVCAHTGALHYSVLY